jgi:general secretion pathway protein D
MIGLPFSRKKAGSIKQALTQMKIAGCHSEVFSGIWAESRTSPNSIYCLAYQGDWMLYPYVKIEFRLLSIALLVALMLGACTTSPVKIADSYIAQDEWMKAVLAYRKVSASDPSDVEYKSRLKQVELKAADYYYQKGLILLERGDIDGAIIEFQQGLSAMPDHGKLQQVSNQVILRKEANNLFDEAIKAKEAGQPEKSRRLLKQALEAYPGFKLAEEMLDREIKSSSEDEAGDRLKVSSRAPITLNFRQTDIRTAFEFIAKSFGIDVVFDESVRTMPVTLFAKDVTFEDAIGLILVTTKTFYKKVGASTILISPDSKEKRGQYEDQMVRVFQLTNIPSKEMAEILKGLVPLKKIIVNESLNTIVVRDTEDAIKVAEKVIGVNDKRPAELILEVEILEVNRSKAERLGLDLSPYSVKASIPTTAAIPLAGSIRDAIRNSAILTLPSATFNFYKQDVDAKTLANPRLRVLSGKSAKIHIGDRVPLRSATIQDATGQVRTTYDYKDVGIRLSAEPTIHLDNSVTVKVSLEVSSLGQNIGTQTEPAFSIGTRNADTQMLLRDGETAILGGLIRDEDRRTRLHLPLLGDIPAIGSLFSSNDESNDRTDVLLTITPRVVRGWDLPTKDAQMFVSGSEERFTVQPLFGGTGSPTTLNGPKAGSPSSTTKDSLLIPGSTKVLTDVPSTKETGKATKDITDITSTAAGQLPLLAFSEGVYESTTGKEFEIKLTGENLEGVTEVATELVFNPLMVKYLRNELGSLAPKDYKIELDEARGTLHVKLIYPENAPARGNVEIARIFLKGDKPGTSFIVYRNSTLAGRNGTTTNVQVRASRIVVK